MEMLKRFSSMLLLSFLLGCATTPPQPSLQYPPPESTKKIPSQELPLTYKVDVKKLSECEKHLIYVDQYITASDYDSARDELKEAEKVCSPEDPTFVYLKAVYYDVLEERDKAFQLYYKALRLFMKNGNMEGAFKAYSGMLSIKPFSPEVRKVKKYFEDDDF
jgi:Tfp pilus assembly protein PilF